MAFLDFPIEELKLYTPPRSEPEDFDLFWKRNLEETRAFPLNPTFNKVNFGLYTIDTYDVTFNGYAGQPVKGWLMLPKSRKKPLACIVQYVGYCGGRGFPIDWLFWSSTGYAHLVMDNRGQGSEWLKGDTPDNFIGNQQPHYPGFLTQGILDPECFYYKRLILDAVRAVEAAQSHPGIHPEKIIVTGHSQGGGLALIISGLVTGLAATMPDAPFLCNFRRAVQITDTSPIKELICYLGAHRDQGQTVFRTLSYFDGMNFAVRAKSPGCFSVGLLDNVCPPSSVFSAYNYFIGPKEITVWEYNAHEAGGSHNQIRQLKFLRSLLGLS